MAIALLLKNSGEPFADDVIEINSCNGNFSFVAYDPQDEWGCRKISINLEDAKELVSFLQKHIKENGER